jgi:predicted ATPase
VSGLLRLGICGPHSSGKTTLLEALKNTVEFETVDFLPEVTRVIKEQGFNINEAGTQDTQILIMATHMRNLLTHKRFIVDRTLIDGLCYTRFLKDEKSLEITDWFMRYCEAVTEEYLPYYTKLFYLPSEIPVHDDGVRSIATHFHEAIVDQFERNIERFNKLYPNLIVTVRGSVEQRVRIVLDTVRELEGYPAIEAGRDAQTS